MTRTRLVLEALVLVVGVVLDCRAGSVIHLESSPSKVTPQLTHQMTLTCSLNSTTDISPTTELVRRGLHNVTSTPDDVGYITSIVVLLDSGVQVARVTEHSPAVLLLNDNHNGIVSGNVTDTGHVKGYISITWTYPMETEMAQYVCEVNGLTKEGRGVLFKTSTKIRAADVSVSDLVSHIHQMKLGIDNLKADITTKDAEISDLKMQLSNLHDRSLHVEHGSVSVVNSGDWSKTYTYGPWRHSMQYQDKTIQFAKAYNVPPRITWSTGFMELYQKHLLYSVEVVSVTTTHFTMRIGRYSGLRSYHFVRLVLEWTSIPTVG